MMKYLLQLSGLFMLINMHVQGQADYQVVTGQVSYISSQHTYVRFTSTSGINISDTLYIRSGDSLLPVLVVKSLSSTSCLCITISEDELPIGHVIIARTRATAPRDTTVGKSVDNAPSAVKEYAALQKQEAPDPIRRQNAGGSFSVASYSDNSNTNAPTNQNFRYRLSFNADNIGGSRISTRTYMSYRHRTGKLTGSENNFANSLKIYSLTVKYDIDSSAHASIGRQMNYRLSGMGSFDGLELEKSWKRLSAGLIGGSRPGYTNYGFDPSLLQFGAYLSYDVANKNSYSGTSAAFMEQLNSGKTDRRFLYFQHSGSLFRKANYFSSFEADLFNPDKSGPAFTSLYVSMSYRISRLVSLNGSYDARKNPVYYETFRTFVDSLMDNSLRQSFRLGTDIRLHKSLLLGIRSSWRFLKSDLRQSKSLSGYLTWNNGTKNPFYATVTGNYIESSFLSGLNSGMTLRKSLADGRLQAGAGYNFQDYRMYETTEKIVQHTGRAELYWQAPLKIFLTADLEVTFENSRIYKRLYLQVIKRF